MEKRPFPRAPGCTRAPSAGLGPKETAEAPPPPVCTRCPALDPLLYFLTHGGPGGGGRGWTAWPGISTLIASPSPLLAVAPTAQLPLVSLPLEWGELRPRVLGEEEARESPAPLPFGSWEGSVFLVYKPVYTGPELFAEGNSGSRGPVKSARLSNKSCCNWCPPLSCWGQGPRRAPSRVLWA